MAKKAVLHKELIKDEEMNTVDVFSVYSVFDRRHVEEWIIQLRKTVAATASTSQAVVQTTTDKVNNGEDQSHGKASMFRGEDTSLIDRWSKAITVRRRTLAYWRRHAQKLAKQHPEAAPQENQVEARTPATIDAVKPAFLPPIIPRMTAPDSAAVPSSKGFTILSETEATRIPRQMDMTDNLSTTSCSTYYSEEDKTTDLPKPPQLSSGELEFVCPYCHVLCPKRDARGRHWRLAISTAYLRDWLN